MEFGKSVLPMFIDRTQLQAHHTPREAGAQKGRSQDMVNE